MASTIQQCGFVAHHNSVKKQCIEEAASGEYAKWTLKTEDAARKNFFEHLCFERLKGGEMIFNKHVYVIASNHLDFLNKAMLQVYVTLTIMDWHPGCQLFIKWVPILKDAFFQKDHFETMVDAIYTIPPSSRIYLRTANAW